MRSAQALDQASGKSILRQSRFESTFVLQFFTLLRREIGVKEDFARVILLRDESGRRFYLKAGARWVSATDLSGPWADAANVPLDRQRMVASSSRICIIAGQM